MKKFTWNQDMYQWERVDRVQEYKGVVIETLTTHDDREYPIYHRMYRSTYPSGKVSYRFINKREGGNIRDLKEFIDFKVRYGEAL